MFTFQLRFVLWCVVHLDDDVADYGGDDVYDQINDDAPCFDNWSDDDGLVLADRMKAQQITEHEGIRFNYMQERGLIMIGAVI